MAYYNYKCLRQCSSFQKGILFLQTWYAELKLCLTNHVKCVRDLFIKKKVYSGGLHNYNLRKTVTLHTFVLFCEILIIFIITIRHTNKTLKSKHDLLSII